ncbi:MAG TPA: TetR/AcrR family transcriptional regulator [Mycobacteriales bacterium]|nr:TetR/AcrR family transcriptional regulator [Mycobacteriales bacterium]
MTAPTPTSKPRQAAARGGAPAQERELRAQGRKTMQRLLAAGQSVFAAQGFHNARVDDIVKAAKTSHGTFYLYFSNKEDLFKALALDTMSEMEALGASLGPVTPDEEGRATMRDWVTKFVDLYAAHGSVIRAWTEWELNDRDLGLRAQTSLMQLSTALANRIHEVRELDDHGVAEGVACLSMLERFNYFRESHQVDVSREEAIEILTRAVFEGFFVPDRSAARRPRRVRKAG